MLVLLYNGYKAYSTSIKISFISDQNRAFGLGLQNNSQIKAKGRLGFLLQKIYKAILIKH